MTQDKINIAELLKDCPQGMELDCAMIDNVVFEKIDSSSHHSIIIRRIDSNTTIHLTKYGQYSNEEDYKCVIFPKGKTTWDGFIPPCKFKAGDVLVSEMGNIVLFSHIDSKNVVHYHCIIPTYGSFRIEENTSTGVGKYYDCVLANEQQRQRMYDKIKRSGHKYNQSVNKLEKLTKPKFKDGDIITDSLGTCIFKRESEFEGCVDYYCGISHDTDDYLNVKDDKCKPSGHYGFIVNYRLATEEEKAKLFKVIKEHGYKWNTETKTLEKLIEPKFKAGDKIIPKDFQNESRVINAIFDNGYNLFGGGKIPFSDQDNWELSPDKFDINTLVPFESKVLCRDNNTEKWKSNFWGFYDNCHAMNYPYECCGTSYFQCIPYEGNEHLLGKTDDCDNFYKTW